MMAATHRFASGKQQPKKDSQYYLDANSTNRPALFRALHTKSSSLVVKKTTTSNDSLTRTDTTTIHPAKPKRRKHDFVELGTIDYVNLTLDNYHGDLGIALQIASETGKPIFANFVEWSG